MGHVPMAPSKPEKSGAGVSENAKSVAIVITIMIVIITFLFGVFSCADNQPGPADCYNTDFRNTYTWEAARPELDAMWADHKLTMGECNRIPTLNQEAQVAEAQAKLTEEMRGK